jgi:hypothetical protein
MGSAFPRFTRYTAPFTYERETPAMPLTRVIVTTSHRGVFVGHAEPAALQTPTPDSVVLHDALMVIRFGTTHGLLQLAATGPTPSTKLSLKSPLLTVSKVTMVATMTPEAETAWSA